MIIAFLKKSEKIHGLNNYKRGWGNGYVAVPRGHSLFGAKSSNIEGIEVHGGLTFSCLSDELEWSEIPKKAREDYWVFGFDTAHYLDTREKWTVKAVRNETLKLKKQVEDYE